MTGKNIGSTGKSTRLLWEWTLTFQKRIRLLSEFAARVRTGYYGNRKQVKNCTVSSAITAIGQTIALACDSNPTKVVGSKRLLPRLQIMLDGYRKVDPATRKKLPVQSNVPELLVKTAYQQGTTQCQRATADLTIIAFYYLLRVGEYTVKANGPIQVQRRHFLWEEQTWRAPMPPTRCSCASHLVC